MKKILIVESEPTIIGPIREWIQSLSKYSIETEIHLAISVTQVNAKVKQTEDDYDMIVWAGKVSGEDVVSMIPEARIRFPKAFMIGISSHRSSDQIINGCNIGLPKPIAMELFLGITKEKLKSM